jgi:hypothetical protein
MTFSAPRDFTNSKFVLFPDGAVMVEPWPDDVLDHVGVKRSDLMGRLTNRLRKG